MNILQTIVEDYRAVRRRDPSIPEGIRGFLETVLCTPGFVAILFHRFFHFLYNLGVPVLPRFLSLVIRWITGIEIHPGARLGKGIFIDHGMGVVIGQTAIVGDDVTLFQGVTLGGTGNEKGVKRHPTIEPGVFIGCGARILGNITVGRDSRIGAGAIVVEDVPPESTMVGMPAFAVRREGVFVRSPKGFAERLELLEQENNWLRLRLEAMEEQAARVEKGVA